MADENGKYPAEGRFLRIEGALDRLVSEFREAHEEEQEFRQEMRLRLQAIEMSAEWKKAMVQERVSTGTYFWWKVGLAVAWGLGLAGFLFQVFTKS